MSLVDIVVVTWDLPDYLYPCLKSIFDNTRFRDFRVILVNNGDAQHMAPLQQSAKLVILQQTENKGWEGGLKAALAYSDAPYILFSNDDIAVPSHQKDWLTKLLAHFVDPKVGAVGPTSNVVMGAQHVMTHDERDVFEVPFLINFFCLIRREALDKVGGIDDTLSGGDDLDQSIRLRKSGYKLLCDRQVFIWHHGFKSGERKHGADYNSIAQVERTNFGLMMKHGLREYMGLLRPIYDNPDTEGKLIASFISKDDKVIDLGCGTKKTVPWGLGVDKLPAGTPVPNVFPPGNSVADVVADVTEPLPFAPNSYDVVVARHVIEHVPDIAKTLRNWANILRHGGKLILAVPNDHLGDTLHMDPDHKHAITPESMQKEMEGLGWKTLGMYDPQNNVSFVGVWEKSNGL